MQRTKFTNGTGRIKAKARRGSLSVDMKNVEKDD